MGTSTCIEINQKWKEPVLLWFVIVSKKGANKSGAVNLLSQPLKEIEEIQEKEEDEDDEVQTKLQLLIDHFSFEKLFNVMSRNGCKKLIQWWKLGSSFQEPSMKNVKFIQAYYVIQLVHQDEHDGFNDWQLFDMPPEIDVN